METNTKRRTSRKIILVKQLTPKTVKRKAPKPYKVSVVSMPFNSTASRPEEVNPERIALPVQPAFVVSLEENDAGCFAVKEAKLNGLPAVHSSDSEDDFNSFDEESDADKHEVRPVAKRKSKAVLKSQPKVNPEEKAKPTPGVRVEFKAKRPPEKKVDPEKKKKKPKKKEGEPTGPAKKCKFGDKAVFLSEIPAICLAVHRLLAAGKHDRFEIGQIFGRRKRWVTEVLKKTSCITGEMLLPVTRKKMGRLDTLGSQADEAIRRYVVEFNSTNAAEIVQFLKNNNIATVTKSKIRRKLSELGIAKIPKPPGPTSVRYYRTTHYRKKHPELFPEFREPDVNQIIPPGSVKKMIS
ncbi:hypothetical protein RvY_04492 [Ramazzottius varieornatus]|uniref:Uncharacterized protein n=1 Tax=Ramazzottius varieornatus TaxID=947166 RepID=A0A1D1URS7_RAMVA|nr:hypothetical protein RvY_04492 [Ramazzottius varieornatus]